MNNLEKVNTRKISAFSITQAVAALIIAASLFLFLLNSFKSYQTEIDVLFIPKDEKVSKNAEYILSSMEELPGMLAFYEKMIAENSNLPDLFAGREPDEKKKYWNQLINAERKNGSPIIKIQFFSKKRPESQLFARQTALTLAQTVSYYYNIKDEAEVRIVEDTVTIVSVRNWQWLAVMSALFGFAAAFILDTILHKLFFRIPGRKSKKEFERKLKPDFQDFVKKEYFSTPRSWMRQSGAPSNLPVEVPTVAASEKEKTKNSGIYENKDVGREPTEEELKKRLNQLLKGDL